MGDLVDATRIAACLTQTPNGFKNKIESILNDSSSNDDDFETAAYICLSAILLAIARPQYRNNLKLYESLFNQIMSNLRFVDKLDTITKVREVIDPNYDAYCILHFPRPFLGVSYKWISDRYSTSKQQ